MKAFSQLARDLVAVQKDGRTRPEATLTCEWETPPGFYRFRIGKMRGAVVSDGPILLPEPGAIFTALSEAEIGASLDAAFLSQGPIRAEQNCLLLQWDDRVALFDDGMGESDLFGPHAGRLRQNMARAGVSSEMVTDLILSHAHPDHCWGTMGADGIPNFPNATVHISEAEWGFWDACNEPALELAVAGFRQQVVPLRDRIRFFAGGDEVLPGIYALSAPGHTPGHTAFLVSSEGERAYVLADTTFHVPLSFDFPATSSAYDYDAEIGAATRLALLGQVADERARVISYHAPWPGIGHVARVGSGFRFVAEPMILDGA
ncbi:MBL fold metallo-hydrolase [Aquabacter sp. CN5-332]|uniref:MBL fold metallo-hydrolase n=1 Tax=Aquabacter sp. CN5-332 TaxID=3156608 RepID=UPI0032B624EA